MSLPAILVIDSAPATAQVLSDAFAHQAHVTRVQSTTQAEHLLATEEVSVIVCRDDLPGETGIMFYSRHQKGPLWQRRILLCPQDHSELTVFLINDTGVFRCIAQPIEPSTLVQAVEVALHDSQRIHQLVAAAKENVALKRKLADAQPTLARQMVASMQALPRLATVVVLSFAGIFLLGAATLIGLYLLKSLLGIDLIPGAHLSDAWPK
jgi:DNA-binding NtrC family response regulator